MKTGEHDLDGKLFIQAVSTLPAWGAADERRIIYVEDVNKYYTGTDSAWQESAGQNFDYGAILTVSGTYTGDVLTVTVDDGSAAFGNALYCAADFHYERCDADAAATMPCRALALEAADGSKKVLLKGQICDTDWDWAAGTVWVSLTTGELTQTMPVDTGDQVQEIGFALSVDTLWFDPVSIIAEVA